MGTLEAIAVIVGVVSGVSGLVLGILNYLHQRDTSRPRLVVRPGVWNLADCQRKRIEKDIGVMEVRNVGQVPVIGSIIGFDGGDKRFVIASPEPLSDVRWPGELKPQHVATLRFKLEDLPDTSKLGRAVAATAVGDMFKASRRDMRAFAKQREAARLTRNAQPTASSNSADANV